MMRPRMSTVLPAWNGQIARIGFAPGHAVCAKAPREMAGAAIAAVVRVRKRRRVVMGILR